MFVTFAMLIPLVSAVVVALVPAPLFRLARWVAVLGSGAGASLASWCWWSFAPVLSVPQHTFDRLWLPEWGAHLALGLDGLSLGFVVITSATSFLALALRQSVGTEESHPKETLVAMLACQGALVGVFAAVDMLFLWACWLVYMVTVFFLVGLRGGSRRLLASTKLALCGFASLVIILGVFLFVAVQVEAVTGKVSFSFATWSRLVLPLAQQQVCLGLLLAALALAVPLLPLEGWWNDAHAQAAPVGAVALLLGPGVYGLLRFALPVFPLAAVQFAPIATWIGVGGAIVAACASPFEADFRRRVALAGWGQRGLAVAGAFSFTAQGLSGGVLLCAASTLALAGLVLSQDAAPAGHPGTSGRALPTLFALSAALVPGLGGFTGIFIVSSGIGAIARHHEKLDLPAPPLFAPGLLVAATALAGIFVGVSLVLAVRRGREGTHFLPVGVRTWPLFALAAGLLILGLQPRWYLRPTEATVNAHLVKFARRVRHASRTPEAPAHLFPDDRSPVAVGDAQGER